MPLLQIAKKPFIKSPINRLMNPQALPPLLRLISALVHNTRACRCPQIHTGQPGGTLGDGPQLQRWKLRPNRLGGLHSRKVSQPMSGRVASPRAHDSHSFWPQMTSCLGTLNTSVSKSQKRLDLCLTYPLTNSSL